jgi:phosphatidylglycerol:prolipoprotein diacylglycerol transferase
MLPVVYKFTLQTDFSRLMLYLVALALVLYAAWSGWRGAGKIDEKTGRLLPASKEEKTQRALYYGAIGLGLAGLGLYYALPSVPFIGRGKGEGIPIHSYGILVGGGFVAAVTAASWMARREWGGEEGEKKREQILDMAFWAFVGAFVGSRVLFILVNWEDYSRQPAKIFDLGGGLVFQGGLIGASLTVFFWARKNGVDFVRLADVCLPTVSLGSAFGRLGCFSSGCCWGDVSAHAYKWGVHFPGPAVKNLFGGQGGIPSMAYSSMQGDGRYVVEATGEVLHQAIPGAAKISEWVVSHGHTLPVYPTQLFDAFGNLLLFLGLVTLRRYRRFHGQIAGLWLMLYAVNRSVVELFRGDLERGTLSGLLKWAGATDLASKITPEAWFNISTGQFISLCMFALGLTLVVRKGRHLFFPAAAPVAA